MSDPTRPGKEPRAKRERGRPRIAEQITSPTSFSLDPGTLGIIDSRKGQLSRSDALRSILYRYDAATHDHQPPLDKDLLLRIFDVFAGAVSSLPGRSPRQTLISAVGNAWIDMIPEDELETALDALRALSEMEALIVLDLNDRFWSGDSSFLTELE